MAKYSQFDQAWIVKSAGFILGPLTIVELTAALKEKRISLLDEVKLPHQRWGFLRENPELVEVIKTIREQEILREHTKENTNVTQSKTKTLTLADSVMEEETPAPLTIRPIHAAAEIEKKSLISQKSSEQKNSTTTNLSSSQNNILQRKDNKSVWIGAAVVLISIIGISFYFLNFRGNRGDSGRDIQGMEILQEAVHYKDLGFYKKAAERYHQASQFKDLDFNIQIEMLPVLVQDSRFSDEVIQIGNRAISDNQVSQDLKQKILNLVALAQIKKGRLAEAEVIYSKLIDTSPGKHISLNRCVAKFLAGDFGFVKEQYEDLSKSRARDPILIILESLAIFESDRPISSEKIKNLLNLIEEMIQERPDYSSQLNLSQIALLVKSGKQERIQMPLKDLSEKIISDNQFLRELNLSDEIASWQNLYKICENISNRILDKEQSEILKANCNIRAMPIEESLKYVRALNHPESRLTSVLLAALMLNKSDFKGAALSIGSVDTPFFELIRSRICLEKKDFSCALDKAKKVLTTDQLNIEAHYILAKSLQGEMKRTLATDTVREGIKISKYYLPLLTLREELGGQ